MILDSSITHLDSSGSLIIDTRPWLDRQVRLTNWTVGIGFYQNENDQWLSEEIDPGLTLITPEHLNHTGSPVFDYLNSIPESIIEQVKPFEYRQFSLLKLLSIESSLQDIFKHSPVLTWLTVIASLKNKWQLQTTIDLLHQKREKITQALFGRSAKKIVRFINKIQLLEGNQIEYNLIKDCIENGELTNAFTHWKSIPVQALIVVLNYPKLLKTPLIELLLDNKQTLVKQKVYFYQLNRVLDDIDNMAEMMEVNLPHSLYRSLRSKDDLNNAHDDLIIRFNLSETVAKKGMIIFPSCPLGETLGQDEELVQIKNSVALSCEGRSMHHCVGGYVKQAEKGDCYFYSVFHPERGTLQIAIEDEQFSIIQFKLACNKKPSEESWFHVRQCVLGD